MKNVISSRVSILILCFACYGKMYSQADSSNQNKTSNASDKVYTSSKKMNETSAKIKEGVEKTVAESKQAVNNIKAAIKIFEPIIRLHRKTENTSTVGIENENNTQSDDASTENVMTNSENQNIEYIPEDTRYNADGSANWGSQNHKEFGCYLDMTSGNIMDDIDAAGNTNSVDVIFTATDYFGSAPMYAFLSPALVKNDIFANYYFRGPSYKDQNIPVRLWEEVNESEIALTNITVTQFDKIKDNKQLAAVIQQTPGFKDRLESRTKLTGKVIAVKTKMGQRKAHGLIYIQDQFGTTGSRAYLKVKIKVSGFDSNGDGQVDAELYGE
ncbi:MAG: hypothetical protein IPH93_14215 [Saprospiraceae bacterium]|nr:hypothetical protein [Saprospiraceae bacterium]